MLSGSYGAEKVIPGTYGIGKVALLVMFVTR
jgi:hypothetical protein